MTLILRGAYTHRVGANRHTGVLDTDCGVMISVFDRLCHVDDQEAEKLVDCLGCLRARVDQLDEVAE